MRSHEPTALAYARRGWPVLPLHGIFNLPTTGEARCTCGVPACNRPGKHPRTKHGCKDATVDPQKIRAHFKQWPDANVGIATGTAGALLVLDVDAASGGLESLRTIEQQRGAFPDTPQCLTGGGGLHFYFRTEHATRNSASHIAPGIDVRGDGGYVVAPPSMHASGRPYRWELSHHPADTPMSEPPAWLLDLVVVKQSERRIISTAPTGATIPLHERNDTLFRLACSLRAKGLSQAAITAALVVHNDEHCVPPLKPGEVNIIAASACRYDARRNLARSVAS